MRPDPNRDRTGRKDCGFCKACCNLAQKHPVARLEQAAGTAVHHGAWRLRDLKRLLEQPPNVVQLDFLETHPLIRPLEAYRVVASSTPYPDPS